MKVYGKVLDITNIIWLAKIQSLRQNKESNVFTEINLKSVHPLTTSYTQESKTSMKLKYLCWTKATGVIVIVWVSVQHNTIKLLVYTKTICSSTLK